MKLKWIKGTPTEAGTYIVDLKYNDGNHFVTSDNYLGKNFGWTRLSTLADKIVAYYRVGDIEPSEF